MSVLLIHAFLVHTLVFTMRPGISYQTLQLNLSATWVGILGAAFAAVPLVLALPGGRLTDAVGERIVIRSGSLCLVVAGVGLLLTADGPLALLGVSALLGIGHTMVSLAGQSLVANSAGPRGYDRAFARFTLATSIGQAAGPALIGLAPAGQASIDTDLMFTIAGALSIVVLALSLIIDRGAIRNKTEISRRPRGRGTIRQAARIPGVPPTLLVSALTMGAVDISLIFLPMMGVERGLSAQTISALLVVRAIVSVLSRFTLSWFADRITRSVILITSTSSAAAAFIVIAFPVPVPLLFAAICLAGVGLGVTQPLTMASLAAAAQPGTRATAVALRIFGNRLAQTALPLGASAIVGSAGSAVVLAGTGAALALASLCARRIGELERRPKGSLNEGDSEQADRP